MQWYTSQIEYNSNHMGWNKKGSGKMTKSMKFGFIDDVYWVEKYLQYVKYFSNNSLKCGGFTDVRRKVECHGYLYANGNTRNDNQARAVNSYSRNHRNFKWKKARPWWDASPRPLDYMPSALTAEQRECDTFLFIFWETGSGDIYILFVKVNKRNANNARATDSGQ